MKLTLWQKLRVYAALPKLKAAWDHLVRVWNNEPDPPKPKPPRDGWEH